MIPTRLVNLRDIASASPLVRPGVVLRSDAPLHTDTHEGYDVAWPPATVVDLRDADERGPSHPLSRHGEVVHLPLLTGAPYTPGNQRRSLEQLYLELVASPVSAGLMVDAVGTFASAPGPILVHCTAGKDRTGITVALTLSLLGVTRDQVVADYVRTADAMDDVLLRMTESLLTILTPQQVAAMPRGIHATPVEAMNGFLDALDAEGGAERWYLSRGGAGLDALRDRLLA